MLDRKGKFLVIAALIAGVAGLSVGFATFTELLTVSSSLTVKPDAGYFKVNFSSSSTDLATDEIVPTKSASSIVTTNGVIDNANDPTIKNLSAVFTEPGQYVEYKFNSFNSGKYKAFLNEVNFKNITGESALKVCKALPGTDATMVQAACPDIRLTIEVGGVLYEETDTNVANHILARNSAEPVIVKIAYLNNDHWVDGDFEVSFGDITLDYATVD